MEWYSAYLYLEIYSYYTDKNLDGFGDWFYVQTQEERDHAMLFTKYLLNNSEKAVFQDIKAPDIVFKSFRKPAMLHLSTRKKQLNQLTIFIRSLTRKKISAPCNF